MTKKSATSQPSVLLPEYKELRFRIVGAAPLVQHNPEGSMRPVEAGPKRKKTDDIPTPEVEAERATYRLPNRQLYIKGEAFIGALRFASTSAKIGKRAAKVILAAGLFLQDEKCPLVDPATGKPLKDYEIYITRAVIPSSKAAVMRARPRLPAWSTEVRFNYDPDILTPEIVTEFMQYAGKIAGVGDQRPSAPKTPGPYGRFSAELLNGPDG